MSEGHKIESGVTAFAPFPAPTYRYVLSSKGTKLNILLEDRNSKKQWCTGDLEASDYLTSTNTIPNVTPADYVSIFTGALDYMMGVATADMDDDSDKSCSDNSNDESSDDEEDEKKRNEEGKQSKVKGSSSENFVELNTKLDPATIRRRLVLLENDVWQLELSIKVRVLHSAWASKYVFRLEPISLERIDILESKLRDVEEVLAVTRKMVAEIKHKSVMHLSASGDTATRMNADGKIKWLPLEDDGFSKMEDGYGIKVCVSGCYIITVKVELQSSQTDATVELHVNGYSVQRDRVPRNASETRSASIMLGTRLSLYDKLAVVVTDTSIDVEVELTVTRIGD